MSDAQFGKASMVQFERVIAAPLAEIWALLTEPALLPQWYGESSIGEGVGGRVGLMKNHIRGVITQWEVQSKLAYTWNVFEGDEDWSNYPESYLTMNLIEREDKAALGLTHLPVPERFEKQNAMGWHTFLDMVQAAAEGQEVKPRGEYMKANAARYGVDLSNLVK
ncbi:MAG: SRPBCC domain-containing protein [Caulobacterales bacterium]